jgi:SAM-dependent methyltransferase
LVATDVSSSHLEHAKSAIARRGRTNVDFVLLNNVAQVESLPEFDAFFSVIVLQHNPPPVIAYLLRHILQKLRPGGVAFFQVPTYYLGYSFSAKSYIDNMRDAGTMEMHCLPQQIIFKIVDEFDCSVREVREDGFTGTNSMVSNSFLITKPTR